MGKIIDKLKIIILATLGGIDTVIYISTPIIIVALWAVINGLDDWRSIFFYGIGLLATLFRAIKIGFMK